MNGRVALGVALVPLAGVGALTSVALGDPASVVVPLAYGGAGAYVAFRRPSNPIGWLLMLTGWGIALGSLEVDATAAMLLAGDLEPTLAFTAWASAWGFTLVFTGLVASTVLFPDGHLAEKGWQRWSGILAVALIVGIAGLIAVAPTIVVTPAGGPRDLLVPNPYALARDAAVWRVVPSPVDLYPWMLVAGGIAGVGLVDRARRATGATRLQYRWFGASILLVLISTAVWAIGSFLLHADPLGPVWILALIALVAVPVAIAIAVLRYRLFEIDRIVSRTIGWAVVTGLLVAIFAGLVVGLQALLADVTQGQTLAIAASTLVAFALFQPVRRRVQGAVDRRFDRARYDGERTATTFAERLRDEVDLDRLLAQLEATVDDAVRPSRSSVWIPSRGIR